jgi:chromosomal replication initiator protein
MNQRVSYYTLPGLKPIRRTTKPEVVNEERIVKIVCEHFKITIEKLQRKSRYAEVVLARAVLMYFLFKYTTLNKSQIARFLNVHHTTIIHSLNTLSDRMDVEEAVRGHVDVIRDELMNL